ncbi:MAG: hypothetical protein V9G14_03630 [Cypionkella sp.]
MMNRTFPLAAMLLGATVLSGCVDGLTPYKQGPDTVIATAYDTGRDRGVLTNGDAAIAYDPDGCQGWIMDDGVEGYSGRRFDPVSGLPVCNNRFPPGTVVKNYQTQSPGLTDYVPSVGRN